tara:strand:- start:1575 stop:2117 length:543 start_codon:yes stop_codon:yes gene_type:complete
MKIVTLFDYESEAWKKTLFDLEPFTQVCFEKTVHLVAPVVKVSGPFEISCLFSEDKKMKLLNYQYRGKNVPTNVLSFGYALEPGVFEEDEGRKISHEAPHILGDIVFSFETIKEEAQVQGKTFQDHFAHLAVHGLLHLLGYDHKNDEEAALMEGLEQKILSELSIPDPYQVIEETGLRHV